MIAYPFSYMYIYRCWIYMKKFDEVDRVQLLYFTNDCTFNLEILE